MNSISMRSTEQANNVCSLPKSPPSYIFTVFHAWGKPSNQSNLRSVLVALYQSPWSLFQCLIICDEIGSLISLKRLSLSAVSAPDFLP